MSELFRHPYLLALAALVCLPTLFPIGRFFFDDFETFKRDVGLDSEFNRSLWVLGCGRVSIFLYMKIAGFLGAYAAVVLAAYQLFSRFVPT